VKGIVHALGATAVASAAEAPATITSAIDPFEDMCRYLREMPRDRCYDQKEHIAYAIEYLEDIKKLGEKHRSAWLASLNGIADQDWFYGCLNDSSVKEIEQRLMEEKTEGHFIVRLSRINPGVLALSYLDKACKPQKMRFVNKDELCKVLGELGSSLKLGVGRREYLFAYESISYSERK